MFDVLLKYNNSTLEQTAFPGKLSGCVCHEVEATVTDWFWLTEILLEGSMWVILIHLQNVQYLSKHSADLQHSL